MWLAWSICGVGIIFCLSGVYFFHKKAFEEGQRLNMPIILMIMGVILIALGTAKFLHLIS
jgi:uncharacterized membrane protein AbrB (regulator of aidB expression)